MYDPATAMFTSIDPKAEEYTFQSPYVYGANNPILFQEKNGENPIRALITAGKIAKRAYKSYKKVTKAGKKFTSKHLKDIGLDEVADMAGDFATIFGNGEIGMMDRIGAVADLVIGTDFNNKGQKVVKNAISKLTSKAKKVKDVKKRPSSFRKKTFKDSWDNAKDGKKKGTKKCSTCDKDVEGNPYNKEKRNGENGWDNDHQPKWKDRDLSGKTRKEVLDEYNKNTRLRCRKCNRSDNQ